MPRARKAREIGQEISNCTQTKRNVAKMIFFREPQQSIHNAYSSSGSAEKYYLQAIYRSLCAVANNNAG